MSGVSTSSSTIGHLPVEDLTTHGHIQQSYQPGGVCDCLRGHPSAVRSCPVPQSLLPAGLRYTVPFCGEARQNFVPGPPVSPNNFPFSSFDIHVSKKIDRIRIRFITLSIILLLS